MGKKRRLVRVPKVVEPTKVCLAEFDGRTVWVPDPWNLHELYKHGYFGRSTATTQAPLLTQSLAAVESRERYLRRRADRLETPPLPAPELIVEDERGMLLHEEVIHLQLQKKLTVCDQRSKELLPVHELWSTFSRINPAFPSRFAVYRRFRKKGWVVRCGLRAGSDFVLYRFGPDIDHAMFSLSVVPLGADGTAGRGLMDWISFQGLHRVAGAIAKDVLLCYVSPQPGHTVADVSSAESAESLTVHEAVVRRRVKLDVTADMHTFAPTSMMEQRMRHGRKRGRKMQQVALPPRFEPLTSTASAPPQRPTHRGWFADEASWLASS